MVVPAPGVGRGAPHTASEASAAELLLDRTVLGSTAGWDWRDGPGGDVWRFEARKTASYRFRVAGRTRHVPSMDVYFRDTRHIGHVLGGTIDSLSFPLAAGTYYVNVDGNRVDRGAYELGVSLDESHDAAIRREDPEVVEPLCERAVAIGDKPALGTFESRPGGARASCGGATGGGVVHALDVREASRVTLEAAAQFKVAIELRPECMTADPTTVCASSASYDARLVTTVTPGRYYVVLDSTEIGSLKTGLPGAAIRGAYSIRALVEPAGEGR
jgi:hypothetical protein